MIEEYGVEDVGTFYFYKSYERWAWEYKSAPSTMWQMIMDEFKSVFDKKYVAIYINFIYSETVQDALSSFFAEIARMDRYQKSQIKMLALEFWNIRYDKTFMTNLENALHQLSLKRLNIKGIHIKADNILETNIESVASDFLSRIIINTESGSGLDKLLLGPVYVKINKKDVHPNIVHQPLISQKFHISTKELILSTIIILCPHLITFISQQHRFLFKLTIEFSHLTNEMCRLLADGITATMRISRLTHLTIDRNNQLDDNALPSLLNIINKCPMLENLTFQYCRFSHMEAFLESISRKKLRCLNLSYNYDLSAQSFELLRRMILQPMYIKKIILLIAGDGLTRYKNISNEDILQFMQLQESLHSNRIQVMIALLSVRQIPNNRNKKSAFRKLPKELIQLMTSFYVSKHDGFEEYRQVPYSF